MKGVGLIITKILVSSPSIQPSPLFYPFTKPVSGFTETSKTGQIDKVITPATDNRRRVGSTASSRRCVL